jgi:tRNA pseudouridine55 synthase
MDVKVEGLLNIDKPTGQSSHDVVNKVRWLSQIRRVGHTGTLDPLATGVLLVCVGRATRLVEYLMGQRKSYRATIRLGQETTTFDTEGEIVAEHPVNISKEEILVTLEQFRGEISQLPPIYSAVKVGGQPLYKQAREGKQIDRPPRRVTVYELELLRWDSPYIELFLTCSSGTYIRSIAHDLGQALMCGGHLTALRRTAVGQFMIEDAVPLDELDRENWILNLQSSDTIVSHLPRLSVTSGEALHLFHGQPIPCQSDEPDGALARVYCDEDQFVGVVYRDGLWWRAKKIFYQPGELISPETITDNEAQP